MRFYSIIAMIQRIVAIFFLILACNNCHTPSLWRDYGKEYCIEGNCWNGNGSVIYFHGLHYRGDFKDGKAHGKGIEYDANNRKKYTGGFKEGRFHGMGVKIGYDYPKYTNGVWQVKAYYHYEGNFANGAYKDYGKKVFILENGELEVQEGEWYGRGMYCKGPKCGKALTGETAEETQERIIR